MKTFTIQVWLLGMLSLCWLRTPIALCADQNSSPVQTDQKGTPPVEGLAAEQSVVVSSSQPVITIRGLCGADVPPPSCSSIVTKGEFETLMNSVNIEGDPVRAEARRSFARTYVELLAFEKAAHEAGLDETGQFNQIVRWIRLRTLADLYRHKVKEQYRTPTQDEIDAYYNQNVASFQTITLSRIQIPRDSFGIADKSTFDQRAREAAKGARERLARGDDPEQIQKDAYASLGVPSPPPTDIGTTRRTQFIPTEGDQVFSLSPGDVSSVDTEPKSYVIYKVRGKKILSEAEAREEILKELPRQNIKAAIKALMDAAPAELNEQYFGAEPFLDKMQTLDRGRQPSK